MAKTISCRDVGMDCARCLAARKCLNGNAHRRFPASDMRTLEPVRNAKSELTPRL